MKHRLHYIFLIFLCPLFVVAQDFDIELEQLAEGIAKKIKATEKTKIAVWGFFNENGDRTAMSKFLTEDFSVYITNYGDNFEVIDRNHLDVLLKEHKLNADGYIDQATAKELGKIIAVDAIITGTYTVLNTVIKLRAKVLDTETARIFAADITNLPLNDNVNSYLGISLNGGNSTNRGFNTSLASNETINNPETVDALCKKKRVGDYCFFNGLPEKIIIRVRYYMRFDKTGGPWLESSTMILNPNESKCLYGLIDRPFYYYVATWKDFIDEDKIKGYQHTLHSVNNYRYLVDKGELKIEVCTSKTYTLK